MALPLGAAYAGATAIDLEEAKRIAGDDYYPSVYNPNTLSQKGGVTVAKRRVPPGPDGSQGFQLFYELHGKGPVKAVFVMGLNNSYAGWLPQVDHLSQDPNYSCLVFDNRGYGNSETPKGLYS
ncbi:hypothetical protein IE53DRAFT_413423 [Violaceomyces palustris]|uniref:Uncharacterized protein n=1 Tax=Violaceomyces palustris TaxID=1673888 RepID=A0ACD0NM13_9BASI|nr:hypothetical protein IE53DRAFT_413423 [Violaceomyces palustris]